MCLPVVPGQLAVVPPAGRWGILQAAQFDGHLLQGSSLGFTLTGDQLSLEDKEKDIQDSVTRHTVDIHDLDKINQVPSWPPPYLSWDCVRVTWFLVMFFVCLFVLLCSNQSVVTVWLVSPTQKLRKLQSKEIYQFRSFYFCKLTSDQKFNLCTRNFNIIQQADWRGIAWASPFDFNDPWPLPLAPPTGQTLHLKSIIRLQVKVMLLMKRWLQHRQYNNIFSHTKGCDHHNYGTGRTS